MANLKDKKMEFIVETSLNLFIKKSIEEVTVVDIAGELGIGEATLYRYFGKKENIVMQAGILLWKQIKERFSVYLDSYSYFNGYSRICKFFNSFLNIYKENPSFFLFINDFDNYVISKGISKEDMEEYEKEILSIKEIYDDIYKEGVKDNSIRSEYNKDLFYFTSTHALLSSCCKFSKQEILKSDNDNNALSQIELLIDILTESIKNNH